MIAMAPGLQPNMQQGQQQGGVPYDFTKVHVHFGIPCYGGQITEPCFTSFLRFILMASKSGLQWSLDTMVNESLVTRARNNLMAKMMTNTAATHFMFIDADIRFQPESIFMMLAADKDVIGGPYPKKSINWGNVAETARRNPDLNPKELENLVGEYVFNVVKGTQQFQVSEPLQVMEIGTGHMMIKRQVFEKLAEAFPNIRYKPDHVGQANFDGSRYIHAYFDTVIDTKESIVGGGSDRYLSEDYMFCQLWRKMGGQIFLCPWMKTQHIGTYAFTGNMPAVAQYTGKL